MEKRILIVAFVLIILLIGMAYSETTNSNIISDIKKSSSGVSFSDNGFGGVKININSPDNKIVYRDLHGNEYALSGLLQNGQIELDSNGNIIRGNFIPSKGVDVILGGNLKTNIPANSKLEGIDGKNFDVSLAFGSVVVAEPSELFSNENSGSNVNYKVSQKSDIKFSDFNFQGGTISHNGKYFFVRGGNNAVINGLSFVPSSKDGISAIFFDEKKVPTDIKFGYTVVDLRSNKIKIIGGDGTVNIINFLPGNSIASIKDDNKVDVKALANGEVMINGVEGKIYPSAKGDFVMNDGKLYLKSEGGNLAVSFNKNDYNLVPVEISVQTKEGNFLLKDKDGKELGVFVRQGQNGWPQIQTSPVEEPVEPEPVPEPTPVEEPVKPNPVPKEMPNWQHNPDNSPVLPPITPKTSPIQYTIPAPAAPVQNIPPKPLLPTKKEFLTDIFNTQTKFPTSLFYNNVGEVLKSQYPQIYEKHFGQGSATTMEQTLNDYKALIASEARRTGTSPATLAETFKGRQPEIYKKYGKYFGFY